MSLLSWTVGNVPIGGGVYGSHHNDVRDRHKVIISDRVRMMHFLTEWLFTRTRQKKWTGKSGGWHPRSGSVGNIAGAAAARLLQVGAQVLRSD